MPDGSKRRQNPEFQRPFAPTPARPPPWRWLQSEDNSATCAWHASLPNSTSYAKPRPGATAEKLAEHSVRRFTARRTGRARESYHRAQDWWTTEKPAPQSALQYAEYI